MNGSWIGFPSPTRNKRTLMNGSLLLKKLPSKPLFRKFVILWPPKNAPPFGSTSSAFWDWSSSLPWLSSWATSSSRDTTSHSNTESRSGSFTSCPSPSVRWCRLSLRRKPTPKHPSGCLDIWETNSKIYSVASKTLCSTKFYVGRQYGKVAYFELSSHQISEPKQQAKRENIYLAKISERLAN